MCLFVSGCLFHDCLTECLSVLTFIVSAVTGMRFTRNSSAFYLYHTLTVGTVGSYCSRESTPEPCLAYTYMGRAHGWPHKLCDITKKLWQDLDPSQGRFPSVGSKEPHLNDLIRDLNEWRTTSLARQPDHLRDQLSNQCLAIPEYLLKDGSRVEESLGNLKKKKQLNLLTDEFQKWWSDVLQPKIMEVEQERQRARQSAMQQALPTLAAPIVTSDRTDSGFGTGTFDSCNTDGNATKWELAKLQITAILMKHQFTPDEQACILRQMAEAIPDSTNTDVDDLPDLSLDDILESMERDDHLPYRSAVNSSTSQLPKLARAAAEGLLEIAGGAGFGGEGSDSRKRPMVAQVKSADEPVYRSFHR